jgi:hypothetical protein
MYKKGIILRCSFCYYLTRNETNKQKGITELRLKSSGICLNIVYHTGTVIWEESAWNVEAGGYSARYCSPPASFALPYAVPVGDRKPGVSSDHQNIQDELTVQVYCIPFLFFHSSVCVCLCCLCN